MMALSDPERLGKEVWVINNPNKAVVNRRSSKDAAIEHGNDDPARGDRPYKPVCEERNPMNTCSNKQQQRKCPEKRPTTVFATTG